MKYRRYPRALIRAETKAFCDAFVERKHFQGAMATAVAMGQIPQYVNIHDKQVQFIVQKCREESGYNTSNLSTQEKK